MYSAKTKYFCFPLLDRPTENGLNSNFVLMIWKWFFFFFFIKIRISSHSSFLNYFISVSFATFKIQTILKHFKGTQLVLISFSYFGIHFSSFRKKKKSTTDCPFCFFFLWSGKWKKKIIVGPSVLFRIRFVPVLWIHQCARLKQVFAESLIWKTGGAKKLTCIIYKKTDIHWIKKTHFVSSMYMWATTWQNQQKCAPSEDSDQPGHPPSLIRVFAMRLNG